jgi:hypothetical protein
MSEFIYNEETRVHTLDGVCIPSVSQIIAPLSDFSMIPKHILDRKCQLGINFHKAIELYMLGDLCMESLDSDIIRPMETFIEWERTQADRDFAKYEEVLFNPDWGYCGKTDRVSNNSVIDFKLRPYNKTTDPLQMAGYDRCVAPSLIRKKNVLSFDIKGKLKIHDASNSQAWPMFQAMLKQWKETQKFNNLLKSWKENN